MLRPHSILFRVGVSAAATTMLIVVGACSTGPGETGEPEPIALEDIAFDMLAADDVTLVDLSYPLSPDSLYWPTGSAFEYEQLAWGINDAGYWYASAAFSSPEHLGTHLDAPIHFGENGWTNAEIPINRLFGPGAVIDITAKTAANPDALLEVTDIEAWEQRNGRLREGSIVIVRSGWAARWPDWNAYYGSETPNDVATLHFPGVSTAAASLLIERGAFGVGIDTASIDAGNSTTFAAHQVLAAGNLFNLENLTNIADLPEKNFGIIALPMKIAGGTGGPARVVAVVPH